MMRPKIVLFGDSITQWSFDHGGWGASLQNHFDRTADVVVRGYSGYNTRWILLLLDKILACIVAATGGTTPAAITVFFGANDASLPDRYSGFQHVPVDEYRQNLVSIVSRIKERWEKTVVVLITPPPIDEDGRVKFPFGDDKSGIAERTNESARKYAEACVAAAGDLGVSVIDLWSKIQTFPGWEKTCLRDGLHLTPEGNKIVFDEVVQLLKDKGLSPCNLSADLPLLADIDMNDPLKTFEDLMKQSPN